MAFRKLSLALATIACLAGFSSTAWARGGVYIGGIGVGVPAYYPGYYPAAYYPPAYAYPSPRVVYAQPAYVAPAPVYYAPAYAYAPVVPFVGGIRIHIR